MLRQWNYERKLRTLQKAKKTAIQHSHTTDDGFLTADQARAITDAELNIQELITDFLADEAELYRIPLPASPYWRNVARKGKSLLTNEGVALLDKDLHDAISRRWKTWQQLALFIKPPPPPPLASTKPATSSTEIKLNGIGRLVFLAWWIGVNIVTYLLCFWVSSIGGEYVRDSSTLRYIDYCIIGAGCLAIGFVFGLRLHNIGYKDNVVVARTLFAFVPGLGLLILFICLFKPPGSAHTSERD